MLRTILIVDDESMNREILENMLHKEYGILQADSGARALAILREQYSVISAVLLDLKMPGMDGFELLKRIRADAQFQSIPVIVVTALTDQEAEEKAVSLGAYGFVTKPYRSVLIKRHLGNAISFRETAALQNIIKRDELTKVLSQRGFNEQAATLIKSRPLGFYVLSCLDIDSFKVINDQYGTEKGDQVLMHIARTLNDCITPLGGICGRISADDFITMFPAEYLGDETLRRAYQRMNSPACISRTVNVRIGRYLVEDVSLSLGMMYDRAMLAKESIRGRFDIHEATYNDGMRENLLREQRIVSEMGTALDEKQFEVWYQPQFNHASGALIGAEALVRWRHPERGFIFPSDFIPVFERNGFIYSLDKYVWEQVCANLRKWLDEGRNPLPVSVNISREEIGKEDIVEVLVSLTQKYHIDISLLRLEITETAFAESAEQVAKVVKQLIAQGFTVEIDDFGSGYSSLNTLKDVPAQIIKLDMKFLASSADSQRGGNIVESVVRMAKWLGMSVIAEGVETLEQANFLRSIGCYYIQGYLYAKPMPTAQYEDYCRGNDKEERLLTLETVENLNNNSFWDPNSIDTLIFNSYVGGACIYEYHDGKIELLRATEKYAQVIGSAGMTVEDALRLDWSKHLDEESGKRVIRDLKESIETKTEVTGEYVFLDLPNCPHETFLRSSMRVIAFTGDRYLVYCTNENITAQRIAERERQAAAVQLQDMMDDMPGGFVRMRIMPDGRSFPIYINNGFVKLIDTSREEIMRIYAQDSMVGVHPDDIPIVQDVVKRMIDNGVAHSARYRLMRGDGSYMWLSIQGRCTTSPSGESFLNIYYTDASEQIKEDETQRSLLDNLPGGAGIYEFRNGKMNLTYQNKSYWELVGLGREAYPDKEPMSAVHPDDIPIIMRELSAALEQHRDVVCDIRLRHLARGYQSVRLVGRIVNEPDGAFLIYATFTPNDAGKASYQQMLPVVLSAIMESTSDLSFAKDTAFRYLTCSKAFAKLTGHESERDVIGKTDFDLFKREMAEKFRLDDETLFANGLALIDMTEEIPSVDGSRRYSSTSKYLMRDGEGTVIGLYGVGRDITASVVRESQLNLINDSIPGGLATYTYKDGILRVAYCNDGFCRLFGSTRERMMAQGDIDPMDWVYEEYRPALWEQVLRLLMDGTPLDCVYRVHTINGGYKWINQKAVIMETSGDIMIFNAMLLDVTDRQEYNERLRISEEENRIATRLSGNVIARYEIADSTLTISKEMAEASGMPAHIAGVPEEPIRKGVIAPDSVKVYQDFFNALRGGAKSAEATFQEQHLGKYRWIDVKGSTISGSDGKPIRAIISLSNVTQNVEREAIYAKWQQSLRGRDPGSYMLYRCNLSSNSSFDTSEGSLLNIRFQEGSFDFNSRTEEYAAQCVYEDDRDKFITFLSVGTLMSNYYQGKRVLTMEYRERLNGDTLRWLRLTVDLLNSRYSSEVDAYLLFEDIDAAKRKALKMKKLSETDPLTGILNRNAFADSVNHILRTTQEGVSHALLMLDIDSFKQVNDVFGHAAGDQALIDIAEDLHGAITKDDLAARLGGDEFVVFLSNIRDKQDAALRAGRICALIRKSFSLEVSISTSVGIALAPLDGMDFDTLYRKADAALYYVKGSGKNNYAFYESAMADEHLTPEPDAEESPHAKPIEKKRRMLIVDDSVIDHAMMQKLFRDEFIVEKAKDGNTALVRLRHYGSAISVILLDLVMPGMDGFEVLKKIQESAELRTIPVIIVSSDESRETCLKAIRRGATDFITKPIDSDLLRIRVHSAISKAENERLRAKNSLLEVLNQERVRYDAALESAGITFVEFDWRTGAFTYYPSVSRYLLGTYDSRPFWQVLLSDMAADAKTVKALQQLTHSVAENKTDGVVTTHARLRTPSHDTHTFRVTVRRQVNEFHTTSKVLITLDDLDYEVLHGS